MNDIILIAVSFIMLHTVDGREVSVNPEQLASVTHSKDGEGNKLLAADVHCVLNLNNGKFISVLEECGEVLRKIEAMKETKP